MTHDSTQTRILTAASDVFCDKGFRKTTVRDICAAADVNVAAVNYHFRDKQNLFYQVLAMWMEEFVDKSGLRDRMAQKEAPEEKLREYIHSELGVLCTQNDPDGIQLNRARLMLRELTAQNHNPDVFKCHKNIEEKLLYPVIQDIIGPCDDPEVFKDACIAATSMSTHYFLRAMDNPEFTLQTKADVDYAADFLTTFAVGGLNAIKERINA